MKRSTRIITLFILTLTAVLPAFAAPKTYRLNVGHFDKVKILDNVDVIYKATNDPVGKAVFTADKEFANAFIFTNNKGTLTIQVNTEEVNNSNLPTLYIYSDSLTSIENSSDRKIIIQNPAAVQKFSVKQIGNGEIVASGINATDVNAQVLTGKGVISITGKCTGATYKMLGTGKINASDLEARNVKCSILGTGDIYCWPTEKLMSRGIGSTDIYYKGAPSIKKTGGGHILPL